MKKVTANLHVTTLGHGYMSWEHTDHKCESFVVKGSFTGAKVLMPGQ